MTQAKQHETPMPWFQQPKIIWDIADKVFKMIGWSFLVGALYVYYLRHPSYLTAAPAIALSLLWIWAGVLQVREMFDRYDLFADKVATRSSRQKLVRVGALLIFYAIGYGLFLVLSSIAEDVAAGFGVRK